MKFVSKLNRYSIMLKQGVPGNPLMAIPPTPGVYVMFVDGQFFTDDQVKIDMLLKAPQCGRDYFPVEDLEAADPFKTARKSVEPVHSVMEMGQGSRPGKMLETPKAQTNTVKEAAEELLTKLMPSIVAKVREQVLAEQAAAASTTTEAVTEAPKPAAKKPGRPKKVQEVKEEITESAAEPTAK